MRRRALLSSGLTALTATAGCLNFGFGSDCPRGASLRLRPVTNAEVAEQASDSLSELAPPVRDAISAAHRGEDATLPTLRSGGEPLSATEYVALDGAYVAPSSTVVSSAERTGYEVVLGSHESTADPTGRTVAIEDLPAVDRTALYLSLGYDTFRKLEAAEDARAIEIDGTLAYPDADAERQSALVPDPEYDAIRIGENTVRFRITGTTPTTIETRRIEAETVATATDEFVALVFDRYGVDLDDRRLSAEQRDIIEAAIQEGYDECAPYSDAYANLQRTLGHPVTRVTDDGDGVTTTATADMPERVDYANYENEWYGVELSEYVV